MKKKIKIVLTFFIILLLPILLSCSSGAGKDMGGSDEDGNQVVIETNRKISYTVDYRIESKEYESVKQNIGKEVIKYNGYVQSSSDEKDYARYVYKVPTESLNAFLDYVDTFGEDVAAKNIKSLDITSEYSDFEARKEVLTASRQSYLALLTKENLSMSDIISIQNKISDIDIELTAIDKKLSYYDNILDYSTITISYYRQSPNPSFASEYFSYLGTLFVTLGKIFLYMLPFIIFGGIVAGAIIGGVKIKKKKDLKKQNENKKE